MAAASADLAASRGYAGAGHEDLAAAAGLGPRRGHRPHAEVSAALGRGSLRHRQCGAGVFRLALLPARESDAPHGQHAGRAQMVVDSRRGHAGGGRRRRVRPGPAGVGQVLRRTAGGCAHRGSHRGAVCLERAVRGRGRQVRSDGGASYFTEQSPGRGPQRCQRPGRSDPAQRYSPAGEQAGAHPAAFQRRDSQLLRSRFSRAAGYRAGHDHRRVVRADANRARSSWPVRNCAASATTPCAGW